MQLLIKCEDERNWDEMVKLLEGMQPDKKVIVFVRSKTKASSRRTWLVGTLWSSAYIAGVLQVRGSRLLLTGRVGRK